MTVYDTQFYNVIRAGTQRSAAAIVPLLIDQLKLAEGDTLIDVGCGEGWWAETFAQHGLHVIGVDGGYVESSPLGDRFRPRDLARSIGVDETFDVAITLEVAEHLPEKRAASFIAELTDLAPIVVFSAAIPGQGGANHINEQWPCYWADLFDANGFQVSGALRMLIWDDTEIENWYRQNLLVAVRGDLVDDYPQLFDSWATPPHPLIHPVLYDYKRGAS